MRSDRLPEQGASPDGERRGRLRRPPPARRIAVEPVPDDDSSPSLVPPPRRGLSARRALAVLGRPSAWLAPASWRRVARLPWARIGLALLATRLVITGLLVQTSATFSGGPIARPRCWTMRADLTGSGLLRLWGNWDSEWYVRLAGHGWPSAPKPNLRPWAFQPLYPTLIRGLDALPGVSPFVAGLAISGGCLLLACELLRRLAVLELGADRAWPAVWFFLALPGSFLFSSVLTEALFVALALGAFLAARTGRWWLACLCVGLAAVTRSVGLLIAVPILVEYLLASGATWRRPVPRAALAPSVLWFALAPAGLAAWSLYAWRRTGDALIWNHIQFTQWPHVHSNPVAFWWSGVRGVVEDPYGPSTLPVLFTTSVLVVAVVGVLTGKLRLSWGLYLLVLAVPPLTLGTFVWQGMFRFLAPAFPLALLAARVRSRDASALLLVGLALVQGGLVTLWTTCGQGVVV